MAPTSVQMWYPPLNKFLESQQDQFARQSQSYQVQRHTSRKLIDDTLRINSNNNNRNLDILVGNVTTTMYELTRRYGSPYICMGILELIVQDKNLNLKTWSKFKNDKGRKTNVAPGCEDPQKNNRSFTDFSIEKHSFTTQKLSGVMHLELCTKKLSFNGPKKKRQKKGSTTTFQQNGGGPNTYFSGDRHKQAIAGKPQQNQHVPSTSVQNQGDTGTPRQNRVRKDSSITGILKNNHSVSGNPGEKYGASDKSGLNQADKGKLAENQSITGASRQNPSIGDILRHNQSAKGKGPVKNQGSLTH